MRYTFILLAAIMLGVSSCKKEEKPEPTPPPQDTLPNTIGNGCYIKTIINDQIKPLYTYYYKDNNPTLIDFYYEHNPLTGAVSNTYRYVYGSSSFAGVRIDTVYHYQGDIYLYPPGTFFNATVYYYTSIVANAPERMDSARIYGYSSIVEEPFALKGTRIYNYDDQGTLISEEYFDYPDNDAGNLYDEYLIQYNYDANGQLIEFNYFNYADQLTYYEKYELTNYFQPNIKVVENPMLVKAKLYAPKKLTVPAVGGNTYVYDYLYQTNQYNYIVEQSLIGTAGDTTLLKLITYECIYD